MITFHCSICGIELQVPNSRASQMEVCPECHSPNWVPQRTPRSRPSADQASATGGAGPSIRRMFRTLFAKRDARHTSKDQCWFCKAELRGGIHTTSMTMGTDPGQMQRRIGLPVKREFRLPRCARCDDMHHLEMKIRYLTTLIILFASLAVGGVAWHLGWLGDEIPGRKYSANVAVATVVGYFLARLGASLYLAAHGVFPMGLVLDPRRR